MPDGAILTVNTGSSSLKFALYETGTKLLPLLSGKVAGIGGQTKFSARDADGNALDGPPDASAGNHEEVFARLLPWLRPWQTQRWQTVLSRALRKL